MATNQTIPAGTGPEATTIIGSQLSNSVLEPLQQIVHVMAMMNNIISGMLFICFFVGAFSMWLGRREAARLTSMSLFTLIIFKLTMNLVISMVPAEATQAQSQTTASDGSLKMLLPIMILGLASIWIGKRAYEKWKRGPAMASADWREALEELGKAEQAAAAELINEIQRAKRENPDQLMLIRIEYLEQEALPKAVRDLASVRRSARQQGRAGGSSPAEEFQATIAAAMDMIRQGEGKGGPQEAADTAGWRSI